VYLSNIGKLKLASGTTRVPYNKPTHDTL